MGRIHIPYTLGHGGARKVNIWARGRSVGYGVQSERGVNCGCAGSLALLLGFPKTLSFGPLSLPLGHLYLPPICLFRANETVLGGYSSGMRSRGTGATWSLEASFGTF